MGQLLYAEATAIREQAKIDAARITQASGNEKRGARSALAQFSAALGNKRRLQAAGSQVNDSAGNSARLQRQLTTGRLSDRIRHAEELGQAAAQAGAAGVGGASVEAYNETSRLVQAIQEQRLERSFSEQEWASGQQRGNAIKAAIAGLDNNLYQANLDYTQFVDYKKPSFFERVAGFVGTAAATAFGGPQAGAAVMGIFEARQANRNGDFAGASSAIMGSLGSGLSAFQTANATRRGPSQTDSNTINYTPINADRAIAENAAQFQFSTPTPTWGSIRIK